MGRLPPPLTLFNFFHLNGNKDIALFLQNCAKKVRGTGVNPKGERVQDTGKYGTVLGGGEMSRPRR